MFRYLLAALVAFTPHLAFATNCNTVQRVVAHKQVAVVQHHNQAVVQYAQPVVAYNANAYYNNQAIVADYPNVVQLKYVAAPQYYSVGASVQEDALAKRLADRVEKLVDAKLSARLTQLLQDKGAEADPSSRRVHPGAKLAVEKCSGCHRDGSMKVADGTAPKLFNSLNEWIGNSAQAEKAVTAVQLGNMPPKGQEPLSDRDFVVFKDYLESLQPQQSK